MWRSLQFLALACGHGLVGWQAHSQNDLRLWPQVPQKTRRLRASSVAVRRNKEIEVISPPFDVDTFSSLREQSNAKTNIRENKCLVCGLSRQEFERREPGSWRRHYKEEHNIWAYFSFLIHLQTKARTEFSGIEDFVEDCQENRSLAWLPRHRALALEDPPTTNTITTATPKTANYGGLPLPLARR